MCHCHASLNCHAVTFCQYVQSSVSCQWFRWCRHCTLSSSLSYQVRSETLSATSLTASVNVIATSTVTLPQSHFHSHATSTVTRLPQSHFHSHTSTVTRLPQSHFHSLTCQSHIYLIHRPPLAARPWRPSRRTSGRGWRRAMLIHSLGQAWSHWLSLSMLCSTVWDSQTMTWFSCHCHSFQLLLQVTPRRCRPSPWTWTWWSGSKRPGTASWRSLTAYNCNLTMIPPRRHNYNLSVSFNL